MLARLLHHEATAIFQPLFRPAHMARIRAHPRRLWQTQPNAISPGPALSRRFATSKPSQESHHSNKDPPKPGQAFERLDEEARWKEQKAFNEEIKEAESSRENWSMFREAVQTFTLGCILFAISIIRQDLETLKDKVFERKNSRM